MAQLPLEGVRILSQAIVWAGPYSSMILGDMGAEVIEIEDIHHLSVTRATAGLRHVPMALMSTPAGATYVDREPRGRYWDRRTSFNFAKRNCKSMTVNLMDPKGRELFFRLVKISDAFIENNAAGVVEKLGIDYPQLREVNPQIVMVRFPGYGTDGPYKGYKGYGANVEAVVGHTWIRGYRGEDPTSTSPIYHGDPSAGTAVVFALLAALYHRQRTGKGQFVDMSQAENVINHLSHAVMDYSMNRRSQEPWANRAPGLAPHGVYPCRGEDYWVSIAVQNDDEFATLCRAIGRPELAQDPRFADAASRYRNQDDLDPIIAEWTKDKDQHEVMHLLQGQGIAAGAVLKQAEMFENPHLKARGYFEAVTHPMTGPIIEEDGVIKHTPGTHLYPGPVAKLSQTPLSIRTPAPTLGQHNEYVYKQILGLSEAEYQELLDEQIIGDTYLETAR